MPFTIKRGKEKLKDVLEENTYKVYKVVQYGQHNINGELHGIGREVWISSIDIGQIKEGQFVDGQLLGFGRKITYRFDKQKYTSR